MSDNESVQSELLLADKRSSSRSRDERNIPRRETGHQIKHNTDMVGYNPTQVLEDLFTGQQTTKSQKHVITTTAGKNTAGQVATSLLQGDKTKQGTKKDDMSETGIQGIGVTDNTLEKSIDGENNLLQDDYVNSLENVSKDLLSQLSILHNKEQTELHHNQSQKTDVTEVTARKTNNIQSEIKQKKKSDNAKDLFSDKEFLDQNITANQKQNAALINAPESRLYSSQSGEGESHDQIIRPSQESTSSFSLLITTPLHHGETVSEHQLKQASRTSVSLSSVFSSGHDGASLEESAVKSSTSICNPSSQSTTENLEPTGINGSSRTNTDRSSSGQTSDLYRVETMTSQATSSRGVITAGRLGVSKSLAPEVDLLAASPSSGQTPDMIKADPQSKQFQQPTFSQEPSNEGLSTTDGTERTQAPEDQHLSSQLLDFIVEFSQVSRTQTDSQYPPSTCRLEDFFIQDSMPSIQESKQTATELAPLEFKGSPVFRPILNRDQSGVNPPTASNSRSVSESCKQAEFLHSKTQPAHSPRRNIGIVIEVSKIQTANSKTSKDLLNPADSSRQGPEFRGPQSKTGEETECTPRDAKQTDKDRASVSTFGGCKEASRNSGQLNTLSEQTDTFSDDGENTARKVSNKAQDSIMVRALGDTAVRSSGQIDSAGLPGDRNNPGRQADSQPVSHTGHQDTSTKQVESQAEKANRNRDMSRRQLNSPSMRAGEDRDVSVRSSRLTEGSPAIPAGDRETPTVRLSISQMMSRYQTLGRFLKQKRDSNTLLSLERELDHLQTWISSLNEEHKAERSRMYTQVSQPAMSRSQRKQLKVRLQDLAGRQKQLVEVVKRHKEVKGQVKHLLAVVVKENTEASVRDMNSRERHKPLDTAGGKDDKKGLEAVADPARLPAPVYEKIAEESDEKRAENKALKKHMKPLISKENDKQEKGELHKVPETLEKKAEIVKSVPGLPSPVYEKIAEMQAEKHQSESLSLKEIEKYRTATQTLPKRLEAIPNKQEEQYATTKDAIERCNGKLNRTTTPIVIDLSEIDGEDSQNKTFDNRSQTTVETSASNQQIKNYKARSIVMSESNQIKQSNMSSTKSVPMASKSVLNTEIILAPPRPISNSENIQDFNTSNVIPQKILQRPFDKDFSSDVQPAAPNSVSNRDTLQAAQSCQREVLEDSQQDLFSQDSSQSRFHADRILLDTVINNPTFGPQSQETVITPLDKPSVSDETTCQSRVCFNREDTNQQQIAGSDCVSWIQGHTDSTQSEHIDHGKLSSAHSVKMLQVPQDTEQSGSLGKTWQGIRSSVAGVQQSQEETKTFKEKRNESNDSCLFVNATKPTCEISISSEDLVNMPQQSEQLLLASGAAKKKRFVPPSVATQKQTKPLLQKHTDPWQTAESNRIKESAPATSLQSAESAADFSTPVPVTTAITTSDALHASDTAAVNQTTRAPSSVSVISPAATSNNSSQPMIFTKMPSAATRDTTLAADNQLRTLPLSRSVKQPEAISEKTVISTNTITSVTATTVSKTFNLTKSMVSSVPTPQQPHKSPESQIPTTSLQAHQSPDTASQFASPGLSSNISTRVLSLPSPKPFQSLRPAGVISPSSTVASSDIFPVSCREMVKRIETKFGNKNTGATHTAQRDDAKLVPNRSTDPKDYIAIPICPVAYIDGPPDAQDTLPTFLQPSRPSMSGPTVRTDLKSLVETGVLKPGQDVLSLCNKGRTYRASLDKKGCIVASGGEKFRTPTSWYCAVTGIVTCRRQHAYNKVLYKGRPLSVYEAGMKHHTQQTQQTSETVSSSSNRGGNQQADIITKERVNLLEDPKAANTGVIVVDSGDVDVSLLSSGSRGDTVGQPGGTKLGSSYRPAQQTSDSDNKRDRTTRDLDRATVVREEEKRLANTLRESRCRVYLIADSELVTCPDLGDRFWSSEFKDVRMSESLWSSVTSWD